MSRLSRISVAAYSASKTALNMGLLTSVEVHRDLGSEAPVILALHTAETGADLGPNPAELTEEQIRVKGCLKIIREKGKYGSDRRSGSSHVVGLQWAETILVSCFCGLFVGRVEMYLMGCTCYFGLGVEYINYTRVHHEIT
ncbi:hypothetical protein EAF00_010610 [Botryotinia globosa]|nr:hypothetical protein EAF00_010610 [Botryotinia globosa]